MGIIDDWGETQTHAPIRFASDNMAATATKPNIATRIKTLPFRDWFPVAGRVLRSGSCGRRCPTLVSDHSNPSCPFCRPLRAQGPFADTKMIRKTRDMNFKIFK